jgi:PglZ domain
MRQPTATERLIVVAVEQAWGQRSRPQRLLLLRAHPDWVGPEVLETAQGTVVVRTGESVLAVADALASSGEEQKVVVLTTLSDEQLGISLLSRAVGQRVRTVDRWDAVRATFGVANESGLDPLLVREGDVIADALITFAPAQGWPSPPVGILTKDFALGHLVGHLLDLTNAIDVSSLLQWSRSAHNTVRLFELTAPLRETLAAWIVRQAGAGAIPIVQLAERGEGHDAVPLALVAGALWSDRTAAREQGRFEQRHFGGPVTETARDSWVNAAVGWIQRALRADPDSSMEVVNRAQELLAELGRTDLAERSDLLPAGLERRLSAAAAGVAATAKSGDFSRARELVEAVESHRLSAVQPWRHNVVLMALRLAAWTARETFIPRTVHDALAWQVAEGSWVDRARQVLINGDANPDVAKSLARLVRSANERRQQIDRAAAVLVAGASSVDQDFGSVVPVEQTIERYVRPLAARQPLLVVVVDGMSGSVATELIDDLSGRGWSEIVRGEGRGALLSVFPSVTRASRTSLLSGRLVTGGQDEERAGVRRAIGDSARLFHEATLEGPPGRELPQDVEDTISDTTRRVVFAVLNAVDDSLDSGDPARTNWTVPAVRHLESLLRVAAASGRVVVLVSDHGHVVDRGEEGTLRKADGGSRWREVAGQPPRPDEIEIQGLRVLAGEGRIVAAVDETLRYRPRKEGYRGGAALAEITIPLVALIRTGAPIPEGWSPAPPQEPDWWDIGMVGVEEPEDSLFGDNARQAEKSQLEMLLAEELLPTESPMQREILRLIVANGSPCTLTLLGRELAVPVDTVWQSLSGLEKGLADVTDDPVLVVSAARDSVSLDLAALVSRNS